MKNTKKYLSIIFALVLLVGTVTLYGKTKEHTSPKLSVSSSASWSEHFSSITEMEGDADIGIVGVLTDSRTELRGDMVFTRNVIEVLYVHSGNIQVGDSIEVLQTSGKHGILSTPALSEVPLMEENQTYALFLKETKPHEKYGQYYLIAGGYQGIATVPDTTVRAADSGSTFTDYFSNNFS